VFVGNITDMFGKKVPDGFSVCHHASATISIDAN